MNVIEAVRSFQFFAPSVYSIPDLLPESYRFKVRNKQPLDAQDIDGIKHMPCYQLMTSYFGMKYFHAKPQLQEEMLRELVTTCYGEDGYGRSSDAMGRYVNEHAFEGSPVLPTKLGVAYIGPVAALDVIAQASKRIQSEGYRPVLVAYTGLVALKEVVDRMQEGGRGYIVIPEQERSGIVRTYRIEREGVLFRVGQVRREMVVEDQPLAFVDNTKKTGATLRKVYDGLTDGRPELLGQSREVILF